MMLTTQEELLKDFERLEIEVRMSSKSVRKLFLMVDSPTLLDKVINF